MAAHPDWLGGCRRERRQPQLESLDAWSFEPRRVEKPWGWELIWALDRRATAASSSSSGPGSRSRSSTTREGRVAGTSQSGRAKLELGAVGDEALEDEEIGAGDCFRFPPGHRAPRDGDRGHDDPRGLDAAPRRRRPARGRLRARRARANLDIVVVRLGPWTELTVGQAAARTGWSPRMLRYLERVGLVVPARTPAGYRLYGLARAEPAPLARASSRAASGRARRSRVRRAAAARARAARGRRRLARRRRRPAPGSSGSSASTSGCSPPDRLDRRPRREGWRRRRRYDVKDLALARRGRAADRVGRPADAGAAAIRERFEQEQPLAGYRISACLHVTTETANLMRTLKAGGADVVLCASNPLSTQDDVAAALVEEFDIAVFAIKGEDNDTYYPHIEAAVDHKPQLTMDDGADVIGVLHTRAARAARRHHRRHGGDDHRRDPAEGDGGGRRARVSRSSPSTTRRRSTSSTTATARASRRSTGSSARRTSCSPARGSSSPATAGSAAASRCAPAGWART